MAGPSLLKKTDITRVSMDKETFSAAPMPIALRFCPVPDIVLPDISKTAKEDLAEMVAPVLPTEHQSTMRNEIDVE